VKANNSLDQTALAPRSTIPRYAYYALLVLTLANTLNYLDRLILSILAEEIKKDLGIDDGQMGFLMGTAFAVFYDVVGIAMGRIADSLNRRTVMAIGLSIWSAMTALGGAAFNFLTLAAARIGVGVGEATANPCSHSLLADYFPSSKRSMTLSIYLTGTFLGSALSMIVGGLFIDHWSTLCTSVPFAGACSVPSWKAALIAVGLPGLPLALLIWRLREPTREHNSNHGPARRVILREFAAAIPPLTMLTVYRLGGVPALLRNLRFVAVIAAGAWLLTMAVGDAPQWIAIGLGAYAILTWSQVQQQNDRPLYALTFGCKTFLYGTISAALLACIGGAVQLWVAPYAMRTFDLSTSQIGVSIGTLHVVGAAIGVLLGGWLADKWKQVDRRAPAWLGMIAGLAGVPAIGIMLMTDNVTTFLCIFFIYSVLHSLSPGAFAALAQDLVTPRMRGAGASAFSLIAIVIGTGAGPYWAGKVSTLSGSLVVGLFSMQILVPIAVWLLWLTARRLPNETPARRQALAEAAGEKSRPIANPGP